MAFTATEQELYDFARRALPRFLFAEVRTEEEFNAFVKVFDAAREQIAAYFEQALITLATSAGPDFLNQHAKDRGTVRQEGETDAALRDRLRTVEDAVTRAALIAAAQAVITADGGPPNSVYMNELRRGRAFLVTNRPDYGNGGTMTAPDGEGFMTFEPDAGFAGIPYQAATVEERVDFELVTSDWAAGDDGVFPIVGMVGNAVRYSNPGGTGGYDPTAKWRIQRLVRNAPGGAGVNVIDGDPGEPEPTGATGALDSYLAETTVVSSIAPADRATTAQPPTFILILPYGTTAATAAAVEEGVRLRRGAGIRVIVERRLNP